MILCSCLSVSVGDRLISITSLTFAMIPDDTQWPTVNDDYFININDVTDSTDGKLF